MLKVLITGAMGFVGRHFISTLRAAEPEATILPTAQNAAKLPDGLDVVPMDVTDQSAVAETVLEFQPSHVIHLAGIAAVTKASEDSYLTWKVHVFGTLCVAHALMDHAPKAFLLSVGSGQIYGLSARDGMPLSESSLLAPTNDYTVTKAAADLALGALATQGLRCVRFRPFNHSGPGQTESFIVPALAAQIARIEAGIQPPVIKVGNLQAERDMLDVRDVVRAYALAIEKSDALASGTILNLASGIPFRMQTILDKLLSFSNADITIETDPERLRPSDIPRFIGVADKARQLLGWKPEYDFEDTIAMVLDHWRRIYREEKSKNII